MEGSQPWPEFASCLPCEAPWGEGFFCLLEATEVFFCQIG